MLPVGADFVCPMLRGVVVKSDLPIKVCTWNLCLKCLLVPGNYLLPQLNSLRLRSMTAACQSSPSFSIQLSLVDSRPFSKVSLRVWFRRIDTKRWWNVACTVL